MMIESDNKPVLFEDVTGLVDTHPRSFRYKGKGRPRKDDFDTKLHFMTKNAVYTLDVMEPRSKEYMVGKLKELLTPEELE